MWFKKTPSEDLREFMEQLYLPAYLEGEMSVSDYWWEIIITNPDYRLKRPIRVRVFCNMEIDEATIYTMSPAGFPLTNKYRRDDLVQAVRREITKEMR